MIEIINNLSPWDKTFFYIAFGATLIFVGMLLISFIGGGEADIDTDTDGDASDGSFNIFTLKNAIGFLVGLGWGGLALHVEAGLSKPLTIVLASLIGFGVMILQTSVFWFMHKLNAPNTETINEAVGKMGTVYQTIPADGVGKISLEVNGRLSTIDAMSNSNEELKTGETVIVNSIVNGILMVKRQQAK